MSQGMGKESFKKNILKPGTFREGEKKPDFFGDMSPRAKKIRQNVKNIQHALKNLFMKTIVLYCHPLSEYIF